MNREQQDELLKLAAASIRYGLSHRQPLPLELSHYGSDLIANGACFVTLERQERLRGCIGSLEPRQPLVRDVVEHAYNAAFRDPRFPPLQERELNGLAIHLSILSASVAMQFRDESDLLAQLRPGIDGLILHEGDRRGTFLPSVWQQLPQPHDFLRHLKQKAGLAVDYWSPTLRVSRYTTLSFGSQLGE
jgi:uncharacterized protein